MSIQPLTSQTPYLPHIETDDRKDSKGGEACTTNSSQAHQVGTLQCTSTAKKVAKFFLKAILFTGALAVGVAMLALLFLHPLLGLAVWFFVGVFMGMATSERPNQNS